jgi:uncharacterized damage-inducible protein DinB
MDAASLRRSLAFHHGTLDMNLEGVTQQDSMVQPPGGANPINWVVGHVLVYRNLLHALLGAAPAWEGDATAAYARGSAPLTDEAQAVPLDQLRAGLQASRKALEAALDTLDPARLAEPSKGDQTVADRLSFLLFHEAYHLGQLGILRRIVGKPGAIK